MIHKAYGNTVQLLGQNLLNVDLPSDQVKEIDIDEIESLSDGKPCNEGSFKAGKIKIILYGRHLLPGDLSGISFQNSNDGWEAYYFKDYLDDCSHKPEYDCEYPYDVSIKYVLDNDTGEYFTLIVFKSEISGGKGNDG
ncbi:hypothetical protein FACS189473_2430 [Spirochaetia bacterium]|nr:hypothetical protein FACS189473_2430 [Spirochaetia bacterium]